MMPLDDPTRISDELKWALKLYVLVNDRTPQQDAQVDAGNAGGIALR